MGIKQFPMIKYHPVSRDLWAKIFIRKDIESGIHGFATPIQEIPTRINNRFLCVKYFESIVIPMIRDMITNIKEKLP
jgi:hypothetical protein